MQCIQRLDVMLRCVGLILLTLLNIHGVNACTRVFWSDNGMGLVVGRTMDWVDDTKPEIMLLPRGKNRKGLVAGIAKKWRAKYGSLVTTAYHDVTVDGINEKRLSGHLLYLRESKYSRYDSKKPGISSADWLQYILDNYASVSEAINDASSWNIALAYSAGFKTTVHVVIEDNKGDSALFEFIQGQLKVYHGKKVSVVTNSPQYAKQLVNAKKYVGLGGTKPLPGNIYSDERFIRAHYYLKHLPMPKTKKQMQGELLSLMRTLSTPYGAPYDEFSAYPTHYRTMIDLSDGIYFWEYALSTKVISIDLKQLNFNTLNKVILIDPLSNELSGDISSYFIKQGAVSA
jgi:penicillin V acylase-like amidase (Ntn superfamily)